MRPQTAPSSRTDISRPAARRSRLSPLFALGALALVLAGPVLAAGPDYIRPDQVDLIRILPPAPAPGSATTQEDFRILLDYQKARTPAQVAAANEDVKRHPARFSEVVGTDLSKSAAPITDEVLDHAWKQAYALVSATKQYWNRQRPYLANPEIHLVLPAEDTASYPSGHATYGMFMAILLANMVPERAGIIMERGREYGIERLIGGVHYPSDVEAGRITGSVLAAEVLGNAAFKADLARAAAEVRTALKLPPLSPAIMPAQAPLPAGGATALPLPAAAAPSK